MQDISPKDRPKLIALAVAIGAVLIYGGKTTYDGIIAASPAPVTATPVVATPPVAGVTPVSPVPGAPAASPVAGALPGAAPADDAPYRIGGRQGVSGRDPFTPVSDEVFARNSVRIVGLVATPTPSPTPGVRVMPNLPGARIGVLKDFSNGMQAMNDRKEALDEIGLLDKKPAQLPPPSVRVLPPPPPPYTVSGVLIGEPGGRDVAILKRDGAEEKKFVVVGDALEGGFTVTAIESGGVVVRHPGRRPVTAEIAGAPAAPLGDTGSVYRLRQTTLVPPVTATLPIGTGATGTTNTPRAK